MEESHNLRGIILELDNRLSDNDRKRLHFFLGSDVPRRIRDDPSLGGTLNLIESLFDQDKINEQDVTLLINAFDAIHCFDAMRLLREHMRRMSSSGLHGSLTTIMPRTQEEEDKISARSPLLTGSDLPNNSIEMAYINNKNINSAIQIVDNHSLQAKEKKLCKRLSTNQKYLFVIFFLLVLLTSAIIIPYRQFKKDLQLKENIITEQQVENEEINKQLNYHRSTVNQTIEQVKNQSQELFKELARKNRTIEDLHNEKYQLNERIGELTDQLHRYQKAKNLSIDSTTIARADCVPTPPGTSSCGCPTSPATCRENCISKFCGTDGRCSGFLNLACECLIGSVWQFKGSQC